MSENTEPLSRAQIAAVLADALPFMQRYAGQTVVIKYGGHAMGNAELARQFCADIVQLKLSGIHPVIVHGGGPQIGRMLERLGIATRFEDGLRVTCAQTVEVAEMVLSGSINKSVVACIQEMGGKAVGISGKDGKLCLARKLQRKKTDPVSGIERVIDLGFVGEPVHIDTDILDTLIASHAIPVIAPIGISPEGETLNINADTFAAAIAKELKAKRLLLLTDVEGVLDPEGNLIPELSIQDVDRLIDEGVITGGMIPKTRSAVEVVLGGVEGVVILDGRVPHAVLLELFTPHGVGTRISEKGGDA
ncbi:acetylglutamate kinase [Thermopetrobacter sp. TC1]|uniref:acetylglutamate kinase n=1 Tax=Thermopetrobacter sp. TC1 TaxID=1495045 RepID=UPI00056FEE0F|nr:acetylglutamate kinase [Thermopetrobacter sp. TC1]